MSARRILIIEDDEWIATVLRRFLEEAGYVVETAREAREGLDRARHNIPDCVICDVVLPDIDGFWVARRLRTDPGPVSQIPFVFLTNVDDLQSRLQGLEMGADVYITKPFRNEEVVAQVGALIGMANRFRRRRDSMMDLPPSSRIGGGAVFNGDIAQFSVATALALLEMERRTGTLRVKSSDKALEIRFDVQEGALLRVVSNEQLLDPIDTLRDVMRWTEGRFSFQGEPVASAPVRHGIGVLLLEAMRREDEANRT